MPGIAPASRVPEPDPLDRLPHTGHARLPDRIVSLIPARHVVAERTLTDSDHWLNAAGRFPATLLVELMAQGAGLLIADESEPVGMALLAGIRGMHIHDSAAAGQTIRVECSLTRRLGDVYLVRCASFSGARALAHGDLQLRRVHGAPR